MKQIVLLHRANNSWLLGDEDVIYPIPAPPPPTHPGAPSFSYQTSFHNYDEVHATLTSI